MVVIAIVEADKQEEAYMLAHNLREAVNKGKMRRVDEISEHLLGLGQSDGQIKITASLWKDFLAALRATDDSFESSYIFDEKQIQVILAAHLDKRYGEILAVVEKAHASNALVLELPFEPEAGEIDV
jgi:hypothetical protein